MYPSRLILFLSLFITQMGCSTDFDIAAPHEDITVVYGLLNMTDTAHYVSVRKAFVDNKNALEMAQVADSSYYSNISVRLVETDKTTVLDEVILHIVDLNNEGYPKKEEGIFFSNPNYVYKFKKQLNTKSLYRLVVTNNNTGRIDSSKEFKVVDATRASTEAPEFAYISFHSNNPETAFKISDKTPVNAEYMRGGFTFHYTDSNTLTKQKIKKEVTLFYGNMVSEEGEVFRLKIFDIDIRAAMVEKMGPAPENINRLMDSCEVWYCAGGKELTKYMTIETVQKQFITSDMVKPKYTNMLGGKAHGIISSVMYRGHSKAHIDDGTIHVLKTDKLTKSLNIVGRTSD